MFDRCITITGTPGFAKLAADSKGRNRGPSKALAAALDPEGIHVCQMLFPHNAVEWRAMWLVKVRGSMEPVTLWMDNGFAAFTRWTVKHETEEGVA